MLCIVVLLVCLAHIHGESLQLNDAFSQFVVEFGKKYVDKSEQKYRKSQFATNLEIIENHNARQSSYVLGVTQFSDLSHEEFASQFVINEAIVKKAKQLKLSGTDTLYQTSESSSLKQSLPSEVDWRQKNVVTSVKDQKSCGSCWAFSAVGSIEGAYAIHTGELVDLSPQYLVDCDYSDNGCNGGLMDNAFEFVMQDGVPLWNDYPYAGKQNSCKKVALKTSILGYYDVPTGNSYELMKAISRNPVAVAIEADTSVFQNYQSGVLDDSACGHSLNHGVLAVGYSTDADKPYYIVKNSWGSKWGENGYIRLAVTDDYYGTCGIHLMPSYAFVDL